MVINLSVPSDDGGLQPRLVVIGIGNAGVKAVNTMVIAGLSGVEFMVADTDPTALKESLAEYKIQLGSAWPEGSSPSDRGRIAAETAYAEILTRLKGSDLVVIVAGMGGNTATGAAPVIARAASELGALALGVVSKPFAVEGAQRSHLAETGIADLERHVGTLIIVPYENLHGAVEGDAAFSGALKAIGEVAQSVMRCITELMMMPGLINLDFADVRAVLNRGGKAMMGAGKARGDDRALAAAQSAITNPLLDSQSLKGARGVLINISGSQNLNLYEVDEAANRIRDELDPDADIIVGCTFSENLEDYIEITVIGTGIGLESDSPKEFDSPKPSVRRLKLVADIDKDFEDTIPAFLRRPSRPSIFDRITKLGDGAADGKDADRMRPVFSATPSSPPQPIRVIIRGSSGRGVAAQALSRREEQWSEGSPADHRLEDQRYSLRDSAAEAPPHLREGPPDEWQASYVPAEKKFVEIPVFYATDRKATGMEEPRRFFGIDRGPLTFGKAVVTVPISHRMGALEAPRWWRFEFSPTPTKHVTLKQVTPLHEGDFAYELRRSVDGSTRKEAFVFIHGFRTSFEDAARRTGQIAYDLNFPGPAILFSWPSRGGVASYPADLSNAERAVSYLARFLESLVNNIGATTLHLIAHSMGNRVLINALAGLMPRLASRPAPAFNEIFLTAPDIDAEVFRDLAARINGAGRRTTLYASQNDEALAVSRGFNGYPRAGDTRDGVVIVDGVETIDVSAVDTSLVGHGYYGDNRTVLADLFYAIRGLPSRDRHGLKPALWEDRSYWVFQP